MRSTHAISAVLVVFSAFQCALAAGAPWGRAAYGGTHPAALPARLRVVSGVAAVAYAGTAVVVASDRGTAEARRRGFIGLGVVMTAGTGLNAASRSTTERVAWTPLTALCAVLAWRQVYRSHRAAG
jgi:hypothetical protein